MTEIERHIQATPSATQWQKIGIKQHHGIVVPLFSLHSATSCGIGEFPDVTLLFPWCREVGLDVIQLLPLNDLGLDTSPYSAISAFALNPLYLGLSKLPHTGENVSLKGQVSALQKLNGHPRVDYASVQKGKETFLREYFKEYASDSIKTGSYQEFLTQNTWLNDYALYKALKTKQGWKSWEEWPDEFKTPSNDFLTSPPADIAAEMQFHIFVQYLCFIQAEEMKKQATDLGIFIKGDIPILINRESADVWRHKDLFLLQYAAGAPPDMYSEEGQKWGFPLYNWEAAAAQGYRWWIERLQVAAKLYHIYRIDHIVGFFRIWAIPLDKTAKDGQFIPPDETTWIHHGKVLLEMMIKNCDMLPIGEDLGTVPPVARICLKELGVCGTKVMRWERRWLEDKGFIDPKDYIPESMTTVSTHDSETLSLWWKNEPDESKLFATTFGLEDTPLLTHEQRYNILSVSHRTGSLFHINLLQEYLALIPDAKWPNPEDERINIPGTISNLNWSYRFRSSVEDILNNTPLKQVMKEVIPQ